jgi:hypothetical protein
MKMLCDLKSPAYIPNDVEASFSLVVNSEVLSLEDSTLVS